MSTNVYTRRFIAHCPVNGLPINYLLSIETAGRMVMVEELVAATDAIGAGFHEGIADGLCARFGGRQTLTAVHHGVRITTVRTPERGGQ